MEKEFSDLENRIWKSYKSRINTAERLKNKNEFIAFLSIYYAAVLSAVSILNYVNKSQSMDVFTIVLSIMVTILFLHFEGRNYKERYLKMKLNYNNLNLLYYEVNSKLQTKKCDEENFNEMTNKYIRLLNEVENHCEQDYIKYAIKDRNINIDSFDKVKYYVKYIKDYCIRLCVFTIPTLVLLISIWQLVH